MTIISHLFFANGLSANSKTHLRLLILALLVLAFGACKKKTKDDDDGEDYSDRAALTNCKLDDEDGRGEIGIGFPRDSSRLRSEGTVVATVIMVDFSDAEAEMTPEEAFEMISGATDTFAEMSYGRLDYTLEPVFHWYRMSKESTEYRLNTYEDHFEYIQEAVDLANADVDFSSTDSLVILSNPDTTGLGEAGPAMSVSEGYGVIADGNEMLNIATSAHDLNTWGSIWLNHEVTHNLGLVDLYAYDDNSDWYDSIRFTGDYSYMGFNSFESNSPGLTAWERWLLGWVDDDQMICANPYSEGEITETLTAIGKDGGTKAVVIPLSETKVAVIESRRDDGIDENLFKTGALVYTVDTTLASGKGPIKVFPSSDDDRRFLKSTRSEGESVTVEGVHFEVLSSDKNSDTIRVTTD